MELLNPTRMQAGYTMGMEPDGRELLVVVLKGTFHIPPAGDQPRLAQQQVPLVEADEFTGEPGFSAPLYESDYAPTKARCDVLLGGSAYAPGGKPAERVTVSLRVGPLKKSFDVVGNRTWSPGLTGASSGNPEPFTVMPISYDNAFGGIDDTDDDLQKHGACRENPAGTGFHLRPTHASVEGKPLPNTEESGKPVTDPRGKYRPMALGPAGRGWRPRVGLAGTYDEKWQENKFPFLPDDFDPRYYQAAPEDQQMDYPHGDEVELVNLTPEGRTCFYLPKIRVPVEFFRLEGESRTVQAALDTILLEPDHGLFMLCWRAATPLQKTMFEVPMGVVGRMPRGWYRARELGKTYYPNLHELVIDRS